MAINNTYAASDYRYTEIIKALEDFSYDNYVKCSTPSIMALMPNTDAIDTSGYIDTSNLMNKVKPQIGTINTCNYTSIYIPTIYCKSITKDSNGNNIYKGNKGDEFIVTFVGGNVNDCVVIGRH